MWTIQELTVTPTQPQVYCCDGNPILAYARPADIGVCRLLVGTLGYLDITCTSHQRGGLIYSTLDFNGQSLTFGATADISIAIDADTGFTVTFGDTIVTGAVTPLSPLAGYTINAFREMIKLQIVPYLNPPSGTPKSNAELQALADTYYSNDIYGFDKAMALYDWTSASFIRQDLFHQLRYTGVPGQPLDLKTMARVIWGCNYPGYTAKDANFMNALMMKPARDEADVYNQLLGVYEQLLPLATAEMDVMEHAILDLQPVSVIEYPQLYRGAMPMTGGYNTSDFSPSLFEYSGNWGPTDAPLVQAFEDALNGCLIPGSIITTKGPWSFSNDLDGAKVWQQGILITCNPPEGASIWPGSANITPFSLNPGTFEVNMPPPTRYRIDSYEWITIEDKPVCHFTMTHLGYCASPLV